MSITVRTTKLIVEHLQSILSDAECRRAYTPVVEPSALDDLGKTTLCVIPIERDADVYTQGGMQKNSFDIDLCLCAKLNHINDTDEILLGEIDTLIAVAENIHSLFLKRIVLNQDGLKAAFDHPEHLVLFDREVFQYHHSFLSVVRINAVVLC